MITVHSQKCAHFSQKISVIWSMPIVPTQLIFKKNFCGVDRWIQIRVKQATARMRAHTCTHMFAMLVSGRLFISMPVKIIIDILQILLCVATRLVHLILAYVLLVIQTLITHDRPNERLVSGSTDILSIFAYFGER